MEILGLLTKFQKVVLPAPPRKLRCSMPSSGKRVDMLKQTIEAAPTCHTVSRLLSTSIQSRCRLSTSYVACQRRRHRRTLLAQAANDLYARSSPTYQRLQQTLWVCRNWFVRLMSDPHRTVGSRGCLGGPGGSDVNQPLGPWWDPPKVSKTAFCRNADFWHFWDFGPSKMTNLHRY